MEQITLDLIPKGSLPVLHASQYDDGRQWKVNLTENGEDYTLSDETIVLDVRKGDGCAVTCAVAVESGKKYVILMSTEQMCAVAGQNLAELQITKGSMKIGTLNFILQVERDPLNGSISSASEIHDLQHQVDECVDNALADLGASGLPYDNTESGLEATNVQQAIDEVNEKATDLDSELDDKADKSNTYTKSEVNDIANEKADANNVYAKSETYTKTEVDTLIRDLPEPMIFKGTLGVGGTITELPTASTSNEGYTYKVITEGTYAGTSAKVGDVFVSSGSAWVLIPAGDEDNDTWRAIKVNGVEKLGNAISSGSVDFVDTTNVKFEFDSNGNAVKATLNGIDTSSEVDAKVAGLIDDTARADDKTWSSNKIFQMFTVEDEASGAIARFNTDLTENLLSAVAEFSASQASGTPTPSTPIPIVGVDKVNVTRTGKNLFSPQKAVIDSDVSTTYITDGWLYFKTGNNGLKYILQTNQQITISGIFKSASASLNVISIRARYTDGTTMGVFSYTTNDTDEHYLSGTTASGKTVAYIYSTFTNNAVTLCKDVQLEIGSTATAYEAYNGTTALINLGGTYYGGSVDAVTGKITKTWNYINLGELEWFYNSTNGYFYNLTNIMPKSGTKNWLCTTRYLRPDSVAWSAMEDGMAGFGGVQFRVKDSSTTSSAQFKQNINGTYLAYELETPETEYASNTAEIPTINGDNQVFADTGDVAVKYLESIKSYIDNKLA